MTFQAVVTNLTEIGYINCNKIVLKKNRWINNLNNLKNLRKYPKHSDITYRF